VKERGEEGMKGMGRKEERSKGPISNRRGGKWKCGKGKERGRGGRRKRGEKLALPIHNRSRASEADNSSAGSSPIRPIQVLVAIANSSTSLKRSVGRRSSEQRTDGEQFYSCSERRRAKRHYAGELCA